MRHMVIVACLLWFITLLHAIYIASNWLVHFKNNVFAEDITVAGLSSSSQMCGLTSSLSPFGVFSAPASDSVEPETQQVPMPIWTLFVYGGLLGLLGIVFARRTQTV